MKQFGYWLLVIGVILIGFCPVGAKEPPLPEGVKNRPVKAASKLTVLPSAKAKQGMIITARYETSTPIGRGTVATFDGRRGVLFKQQEGVYEALFGLSVNIKPGGHTLQIKSPNGKVLHKQVVEVADGRFGRQNIYIKHARGGGGGLKPIPGELEAIQALKVNVTPKRFWQGAFVVPTPDCMNSRFGVKRYYNGVYSGNYHKGVDLRSPHGRPIKAVNDGVVKIATTRFRLHGGTVGLDHGQGVNSIYIHMSKLNVQQGDTVKKGDVIGYVGSTGFATGPHLHWGLYVNGVPVNPQEWVRSKSCS